MGRRDSDKKKREPVKKDSKDKKKDKKSKKPKKSSSSSESASTATDDEAETQVAKAIAATFGLTLALLIKID